MKTVASLTLLLSLFLSGASLANSVSIADCTAQRTSLEIQINEARATNSLLKIAGLEKALIELNISCEKTEAALQESQNTINNNQTKFNETLGAIDTKIDQNKAAVSAGVTGATAAGTAAASELKTKLDSAKTDLDLSGLADEKNEGFIDGLSQKKDEVLNQLGEKKDAIIGEVSQTTEELVAQAKQKKDELVAQFDETKKSIVTEIDQKTDDVINKVGQKKDQLVSQFDKSKDSVIEQTGKATTKVKEGIIDPLKQKVDGMADSAEDNVDEIISNMEEKKDSIKPIDQNINPVATLAEREKAKKDVEVAKRMLSKILKINY